MAGLGSRLRPHTWSKPKQLISLAGKTVLDHVLDMLNSLPDPDNVELVNIIGYLGEQIEAHMQLHYPKRNCHFVVQNNPRGQSHAISLARQHLNGPMLMVFADTLIQTDLSFLKEETADAVAWVKRVPDPRRFGVAEVGPDGWVTRLIEKPKSMENNLVLVGCYYFKNSETLLDAIDEQMRRGIQLKGEYFLADAVNIMLERGAKMRVHMIQDWLDAGTPEAILETNRYLLDHRPVAHAELPLDANSVIIPPVYIHPEAEIKNSVIGPYVSLGAGCEIEGAVLSNTIIDECAHIKDLVLQNSMVGRMAQIEGHPYQINAGDNTNLQL